MLLGAIVVVLVGASNLDNKVGMLLIQQPLRVRDAVRALALKQLAAGVDATEAPMGTLAGVVVTLCGYLACATLGMVCVAAARYRATAVVAVLLLLGAVVWAMALEWHDIWLALFVVIATLAMGEVFLLVGGDERFACLIVGFYLTALPMADVSDMVMALPRLTDGRASPSLGVLASLVLAFVQVGVAAMIAKRLGLFKAEAAPEQRVPAS